MDHDIIRVVCNRCTCPEPYFLSQREDLSNPSADPKIQISISHCPWKSFCSSGLNPPIRPPCS
jgi:hypothetical protein